METVQLQQRFAAIIRGFLIPSRDFLVPSIERMNLQKSYDELIDFVENQCDADLGRSLLLEHRAGVLSIIFKGHMYHVSGIHRITAILCRLRCLDMLWQDYDLLSLLAMTQPNEFMEIGETLAWKYLNYDRNGDVNADVLFRVLVENDVKQGVNYMFCYPQGTNIRKSTLVSRAEDRYSANPLSEGDHVYEALRTLAMNYPRSHDMMHQIQCRTRGVSQAFTTTMTQVLLEYDCRDFIVKYHVSLDKCIYELLPAIDKIVQSSRLVSVNLALRYSSLETRIRFYIDRPQYFGLFDALYNDYTVVEIHTYQRDCLSVMKSLCQNDDMRETPSEHEAYIMNVIEHNLCDDVERQFLSLDVDDDTCTISGKWSMLMERVVGQGGSLQAVSLMLQNSSHATRYYFYRNHVRCFPKEYDYLYSDLYTFQNIIDDFDPVIMRDSVPAINRIRELFIANGQMHRFEDHDADHQTVPGKHDICDALVACRL